MKRISDLEVKIQNNLRKLHLGQIVVTLEGNYYVAGVYRTPEGVVEITLMGAREYRLRFVTIDQLHWNEREQQAYWTYVG